MIKYSIIINAMGEKYVLIVDSWIDNDGEKTEVKGLTKIGLELTEAFAISQEFINQNSK